MRSQQEIEESRENYSPTPWSFERAEGTEGLLGFGMILDARDEIVAEEIHEIDGTRIVEAVNKCRVPLNILTAGKLGKGAVLQWVRRAPPPPSACGMASRPIPMRPSPFATRSRLLARLRLASQSSSASCWLSPGCLPSPSHGGRAMVEPLAYVHERLVRSTNEWLGELWFAKRLYITKKSGQLVPVTAPLSTIVTDVMGLKAVVVYNARAPMPDQIDVLRQIEDLRRDLLERGL